MFSFLKTKVIYMMIFIMSCCLFIQSVHSSSLSNDDISMDLQNVNIQDAIRELAKFNNTNVVISPAIHGVVSLHLKQISASKAFDLLLNSHELSKWEQDKVWFIVPQDELMQRQQEKIKLQTLLQESSPLMTRTWQIRYAKADDIAHLLQDNNASLLSKRGHVRVDGRTNILCVQDIEDRLLAVHSLIKRLDIPVQQVLIEAHLASVDSDYERELGIGFSMEQRALDSNTSMQTNTAHSHYSLAVITLANGSVLDMQLAALENEGHGELISSPSLFTANQQTASIESGEEIPYQEISKSGATSVVFKKAVLSLKVTPQIMPGNQVLLQLQVNQDKPSNRMVLGVPAISTRQISTHILVKSGQTVVLGGIYEMNKEKEEQRIPFLGKIPIIGRLFGQKNTAEKKRELLIFVTPKIII
jgi:type IV pilus assembly protein PilQ